MNWKRYALGLVNAFISGVAASSASFGASTLLGDAPLHALKIAGITAAVAGIVSAFKWLAQHPLPGSEQ